MPSDDEILVCIDKLRAESAQGDYKLNPIDDDLRMIITGYLENEKKFGYPACPCRLPTGNFDEDKDIICPCDYRDDDIVEYGSCYCSLYVDDEISKGKSEPQPIPERRDVQPKLKKDSVEGTSGSSISLKTNIWRCPVCGYLCAKDQPPPKCPICGVPKERFELFLEAG